MPQDDSHSPAAVLDTNAVLDWLLFADPACVGLAEAIGASRLRWLVCPRIRDELADVLERGLAARRGASVDVVLAAFDRHAVLTAAPPAGSLRCSDPDDQVFVDLACASGAVWLISRDRALLKLARRAQALALTVVTPAAWSAASADSRRPIANLA